MPQPRPLPSPREIPWAELRRRAAIVYLWLQDGWNELSQAEREEIRKLRAENFELRRANEILKAASVFFATELDADRTK